MKQFTAGDGVEIVYDEWGDASAEPPVVLHHGFAANAHLNWVAPGIVAALVEAADTRFIPTLVDFLAG